VDGVIRQLLRLLAVLTAIGLLACASAEETAPVASPTTSAPIEVLYVAPVAAETVTPEPTTLAGPLAGRRICIDPGHDAYWVAGASGRTRTGAVPAHPTERIPLHEHELTLSVAYRLKALLEADGADICITRKPRDEGGGLQLDPYDFTGDGRVRTIAQATEDEPERIQPRIDWANAFEAEVLVSVHFNGSTDARVRGSEVYFTDAEPRHEERRLLAMSLLMALTEEMRGAGHNAIDRGVRSDAYQRYSPEATRRLFSHNAAAIRDKGLDPTNCAACYRLLTTGNNPMSLHAGRYVGALVEVEFLSNPDVVEDFLLRPGALDVVAQGLHNGLRDYFEAPRTQLP
jgi:N-acetylmuramoyl-L-alanine amidase